MIFNDIEHKLELKIVKKKSLSGGSIASAFELTFENGSQLFLKTGVDEKNIFHKEANGLNELRKANAFYIPKIILVDNDYLLLEKIISKTPINKYFENFALKLAKLHSYSNSSFGFYEDNYIGSTPQINSATDDEKNSWQKFYFNKRLKYQFLLAVQNGYVDSTLAKCFLKLENMYDSIILDTATKPSLLHGDLWSGNFITNSIGEATIIDPAVCYGHPELELAMTKLFGGFPEIFYTEYKKNFPLEEGTQYRENIYKLYHILNHLNMFGSSYYSQVMSLIKSYL